MDSWGIYEHRSVGYNFMAGMDDINPASTGVCLTLTCSIMQCRMNSQFCGRKTRSRKPNHENSDLEMQAGGRAEVIGRLLSDGMGARGEIDSQDDNRQGDQGKNRTTPNPEGSWVGKACGAVGIEWEASRGAGSLYLPLRAKIPHHHMDPSTVTPAEPTGGSQP